MKKRMFVYKRILIILMVLIGISSCKNHKDNFDGSGISDLPPSLNEKAEDYKTVIEIPENQADSLKIPLHEINLKQENISLLAPGEVTPAPNYLAIISAPVEGRVLQLTVNEGDKILKGQVILELESLTYGTLVAEYLQAKAEENYQANQLKRIEQLVNKGINTESELEKVKSDFARAKASIQAAYAKLRAVGATDKDINKLGTTENINPRLKVLSPISGTVDTHEAELGQAVEANQQVATVVNLDRVLVKSYLSPEDGSLVSPGDSVVISHRLLEGNVVWGVVSTINPGLDQTNKSVVVNTFINNKNGWLTPGDNVRTELFTQGTASLISIPLKAVTYNNDQGVVFVKIDTRHYEMRNIKIEEIRNNKAIVSEGLKEGENIAVGQVFSLKALARYKLIAE